VVSFSFLQLVDNTSINAKSGKNFNLFMGQAVTDFILV